MSMIFRCLLSLAQTHQVSGIVKDVTGEPVIGVNVSVQGTGNGSITDLDGKFVIPNVKEKDVLIVSYIGYLTQSIPVGKQTSFTITLKEDAQALDEVVVVGYGVQKKRDLSGAVSSVKSRDITAIPTTNALEALQGKVAGLDLTSSSGKAGAELSFTIRGERSLKASNKPLILVDGVDYGTTLDINPSDIESIEVLKDASSTAIYGTRGANGIIIVTTKKGKTGKSSRMVYLAALALGTLLLYFGMLLAAPGAMDLYRCLLVVTLLSLIFVAIYAFRANLRNIFITIGLFLTAMLFVPTTDYIFNSILKEHQQNRILSFLGLVSDPLGTDYNVNQAKIAIGSGGWIGKGFLQGTQIKYVLNQRNTYTT